MTTAATDIAFAGSIPELYERYLVPLIFAPFAADLAARARRCEPEHVLEIAAGTGVVTRRLADELPLTTAIVATDLNEAMLAVARERAPPRAVTWQRADAMALPFDDASFDLVICQFGVMFFPDRPKAFAEARRVLRPKGTFLFNVWDALEENEFPRVVMAALDQRFPENPPSFMRRIPHGYFNPDAIRRDLSAAGFRAEADIASIGATAFAESARAVAIGFCQATPMRGEIEGLGASALQDATEAAAAALRRAYGDGPVSGKIRALVAQVVK